MKCGTVSFGILLCCFLPPCWCAAVQPYVPVIADPILEPWRWRHEEMLDDLGVLCMDEASDGTLWFGGYGCVAHYDGGDVTRIPFDDELLSMIKKKEELPQAKSLVVLRNGDLLVLVDDSLVLLSGTTWRVIVTDVGASSFTARMEQGGDGTVWLIVPRALWRISKDLTDCSVVMKASGKRSLMSFCLDRAGDLRVVEKTDPQHSRLVHIPVQNGWPRKKPDWREFSVPFVTDHDEARIVSGRDGLLWYADSSGQSGLEVFDPQRGGWIDRKGAEHRRRYYSLIEGRDGKIRAGAEGQILVASHGENETVYSRDQLQLPQVPLSLYEAGNGRIWVIGRIGYVYSADVGTGEWMTYAGLHFQCETADGVQWFFSRPNQIVVSHDPRSGKWLQYGLNDGMINRPKVLISSSHGLVWVAGSHDNRAAISVFDGSRWSRVCHPEFAQTIEPNSVFEASDGTVWFGAGGQLLADIPRAGGALQYKVEANKTVRLLKHHTLPDFPYFITSMIETPDKTLWVGSTMLFRYDGTLQAHSIPDLPKGNTVDMVLDHQQTLWVAKENFGIYRKQGDQWRMFSTKDGLAGLLLSHLLVLRDGSILASSGGGISRFDGKTWTTHAYSEWFAMSKRESGLRESADGSIWLNYAEREMRTAQMVVNRATSVCTIRHRPETNPPDTRITDCLEHVAQPGNSTVAWSGHDPWSSTPQGELQYSWRLDEGEWSAFSRETGKTFLKLESGRHTIEVRARDRAFNIDPTPARVEFAVIPPIWRQPWFVSLISFLSGLIVLLTWILIRTRERHLEERQAEHEAFLVREQEEHEKNLIERQVERERHFVEIDRLKTGFFTNISHELRTPLTVILGPLEMMQRSEADPKKKSVLSMMVRNAHRVATLITQLLDFRKLEEGKIGIEATYGDLVPVVRDWMDSLQPLAESAGISCSLESVAECRGWFDVDKIHKIFTNLVANAIKYTKSGGKVRVCLNVEADDCRAETVEDLSAARLEDQEPVQPCKRRIKFVVEDTGVGVSQEHLSNIFERFYRIEETAMVAGTGIGLNLTKELVDLLGGEIRVESPVHSDAERPGTRFTVRLPVDGSAMSGDISEKPVCEDPSAVELTNRTDMSHRPNMSYFSDEDMPLILVVEDDEDIRNFMIEGLESLYRVETAENGAAGLQRAKEQVPDLIVTDLMMPVMDGIALCSELKTSQETSHIPVVMLTAKASLEHQIEGLKTGADDYVTKPFHMVLLRTRIANLLESRRVLREQFCREYPVLTPKIPENTPDKEFLEKAIRVLEENYTDWSFNSDEFSAALNMSLSTLHRKLKAVADRTPGGFIHDFRMMRAAELLAGTSYTITEIAFQVGFDDSSNFSRTFKKLYEMTPSEYRSTHQTS